jgi:two-component system sensor histidine kinase RegB
MALRSNGRDGVRRRPRLPVNAKSVASSLRLTGLLSYGEPVIHRSPASSSSFLSTPAITLRWVLRLRWWAVLGQLGTIAGTALGFHLTLPLLPLTSIVASTAISNAALVRWMRAARSVSPRLVAAVLAVDTLSLGALLFFTGGPSNPFSVLFLVQITIAALVLGIRYAAAIVGLSVATYALLFFDNVPLAGAEHMHHAATSTFNLHLQGMFLALSLAAILIAYFVTRVSRALHERDAQLAEAQNLAAINERLASLSTLAAGAAHELGTPLATIAVASTELQRAAERIAGAEELRDDARLIREQVERCRDIVQRLGARSAGTLGEAPELVEVGQVISELRRKMDEAQNHRLDVEVQAPEPIRVPWRGLAQALGSLVKNAFDASDEEGARVLLAVEASTRHTRFSVIDHGRGIAPEDLPHVGEPFYTTKGPGAGMGLGVFLARAFADRLGGQVALSSEPGLGTRAVIELPIEKA